MPEGYYWTDEMTTHIWTFSNSLKKDLKKIVKQNITIFGGEMCTFGLEVTYVYV